MVTADQFYCDPSALRSLYLHDPRSRAMGAWRASCSGALPVTKFVAAEMANAFALGEFRGDIGATEHHAIAAHFHADFAVGRLSHADLLWRRALERAAELSRVHTAVLGTRALDGLHVASALELGARTFVTYDTRQAALAKAVGLKPLAP
ncbi:MAG: type II toxin-antitoxin system VapC family toxin [Opitutaceae bacterium]|nr:type II toxin-antitoxin system VapC family toxin [Opitutaceae bacterium]